MFKVTDYFYTPADIVRALQIRHFIGLVAGVFVAAGLILMGAGTDVTALASVIVATIIWRLDARIPFGGAIVCFVAIMIASVINPSSASESGSVREKLAVLAFYCLVVGVLLLIREHIKTPALKPYIPQREAMPQSAITASEDDMLTQLAKQPHAKPVHAALHNTGHATVPKQQHPVQRSTAPMHKQNTEPARQPALPHLRPQHPTMQPKQQQQVAMHSKPQQQVAPQQRPDLAPPTLLQRPRTVPHPQQHRSRPMPATNRPMPVLRPQTVPAPTPAPVRPTALPHMQRSPYLLDLRNAPKKRPVAVAVKKPVNDVGPPKPFKPSGTPPDGLIRL